MDLSGELDLQLPRVPMSEQALLLSYHSTMMDEFDAPKMMEHYVDLFRYHSKKVYSSPLTRAVQTAIIGTPTSPRIHGPSLATVLAIASVISYRDVLLALKYECVSQICGVLYYSIVVFHQF